jgi:hypothetical protein
VIGGGGRKRRKEKVFLFWDGNADQEKRRFVDESVLKMDGWVIVIDEMHSIHFKTDWPLRKKGG